MVTTSDLPATPRRTRPAAGAATTPADHRPRAGHSPAARCRRPPDPRRLPRPAQGPEAGRVSPGPHATPLTPAPAARAPCRAARPRLQIKLSRLLSMPPRSHDPHEEGFRLSRRGGVRRRAGATFDSRQKEQPRRGRLRGCKISKISQGLPRRLVSAGAINAQRHANHAILARDRRGDARPDEGGSGHARLLRVQGAETLRGRDRIRGRSVRASPDLQPPVKKR